MKRTKRMLLLLMACVLSLAFGVLFSGCVVDNLGGNSGNSSSAGGGTGNVPGVGDEEEEYYIVDVQMITPPTISEYGEGDIFDPTGMVLKVIWNDGWEQIVNDGVNCLFSPAGAITADTEAITATYDDKVFTLPIHVNKIAGVEVISQPARTLYAEGEAFSSVGLQIVTVLENGEVGKAITDYTLSENAAKLSVQDKKVTVSCQYQGETFTYDIPITVVSKDAVVTIEAEASAVVNGEKVTVSTLTQYASGSSFVRNLKKGGTITINVPATKATTASLRFVASSHEDDPNGGAFTIPLKVSEYLTVTFNGEEIALGDEAILPG
ncbi:MAG: hypothetical protein J6A46_01325, partial [Clostridia bacterium]|nr:hypothetical protein [Clostridia bacterium]